MPTFYIVPPRKTPFGEYGFSIAGILGIKTNLPGNAPITSSGALQLDQGFEPIWTGEHTFNNTVTFNGDVIFNNLLFDIEKLYTENQTLGDIIYFNGTNWSRFGIGTSPGSVLNVNDGTLAWTNSLNVSTTTTGTLNIGSLNGVLKATNGLVSGSSGLNDLTDVQISSPASNQFLKYNPGTNKWVNSNVPLPDRTLIIRFLNGATPTTTGADQEIATVPYEPTDGESSLLFLVTRITLQVEKPSLTGNCVVRIQRVNANTAFPEPSDPNANFLTELTLESGETEVFINRTNPTFNVSISSGQRLRLIIDQIANGAENWTVQIEASAVSLYEQPPGVVPISMGGTGRSTIGAANSVLTVGKDADKLIYKNFVAGPNISIVSAPILSEGNEVGGTITISYTGSGGGGTGNVNLGNQGELAFYSAAGTTLSGINNLLWNNTDKKLSITALPSTWSSSKASLLIGTSVFGNGNANGTIIAVNLPSDPSFTGNFIDFQNNNSSKFSVSSTGSISGYSLNLSSSAASADTSTGALVVTGGVGIGGALNIGTPLAPSSGGTGHTTFTDGQLLIGNSLGKLSKNTLQGSNGIGITNGDGTITITNNRLNTLNSLTATSQTFAVGTTGTDFNISSSESTHTFNLPDASATARGLIATSAQTFAGKKTFNNEVKSQDFITGHDGYFGGDPTVFIVGGNVGHVHFGIMKNDSLSHFSGIKIEEKLSPTLGAGFLHGEIVFYTEAEGDTEGNEFSLERLRINGLGNIIAQKDVTINGKLVLPNNALESGYGGTGFKTFNENDVLIGNSSSSLSKVQFEAGNNISITYPSGKIKIESTAGGGTVTNIGLSVPDIFNLNTSSITTSGTFQITLANQTANYVFAGPTTGSASSPAFRALVAADIPSLNYAPLTSGTSILSGNGSGGFSSVTIGSGLSFNSGTLTNTSPDVIITLTASTNITISGTYPSFTISSVNTTYAAGNGLNLSGTTFSINTNVVVNRTGVQTVSNKTISTSSLNTSSIVDCTIGSSGIIFTGSSGSGTSILIASASPSSNSLTLPTGSGTIALVGDVGNGTLTLGVNGNGISGSASFSANQNTNSSFTVSINATSASTADYLVIRDGSGGFSAGAISASSLSLSTPLSIASGGTGTSTVTANYVFAGPTSGSAAAPSFRGLDASDIPALSYAPPTSGTSILAGNGSGGFTSVTVSTGLSFATNTLSINTSVVLTLSDSQEVSNKTIATTGLIFKSSANGLATILAGNHSTTFNLTLPNQTGTIARVEDIGTGVLTISGSNGLSIDGASSTFSANATTGTTITITSNATSSNENSTIVSRDSSGGFSAGAIAASSLSLTTALPISSGGTGSTTRANALSALSDNGTVGIAIFEFKDSGIADSSSYIRINSDSSVSRLSATDFRNSIGAGTGNGTVTSVNVSLPTSVFNNPASPITSSGTLSVTFKTQTQKTFFAGPTSGSAANPTFRTIGTTDLPDLSSIYAPVTSGNSILAGNGTGGFVNVSTGTGLSYNSSTQTLTNTSPDQVVSLSTGNANVSITGTYPNFTISTNDTTYTNGNGITLTGTSFSVDTSIVATLTNSQTLQNKTITGTSNTLTVRLANDVTGTLPVANGGTGTADGSITGTGTLTFTSTGSSSNIVLAPGTNGYVDVSSKKIKNLAHPPVDDNDAATKKYVDENSQGLIVKEAVRVATIGNLTANYYNGAGNDGIGATLTNSGAQVAISIDNVTLANLDRVLVKNQTNAEENGIYYIAQASDLGSNSTNWVLTRADDANEDAEITSGLFVFVAAGDENAATGWVMTTDGAIDIGTTEIYFSQFSGNTNYTVTSPLTINGTIIGITSPLPVANGGLGINFASSSGILKFTAGSASLVTAPTGAIVGTSDSQTLTNKTLSLPTIGGTGARFNGSTSGQITLKADAIAGTNTITLPARTGTVITDNDTGTVTSNMIADGTIVNGDISASAAIAISKLAASTISGISLGNNLNSLSTSSGGGLNITGSSTSYNGSTTATIAIDTSVVATLSDTQSLSNKTLNSPRVGSIFDLLSTTLTTTSTSSGQILHSISASTYRSVKYLVQITSGSSYHFVEIILLHDGTNVTISEYGTVLTGTSLSTFQSDIDSGNLRLTVTPANADETVYKAAATAIRV